MNNFVKRQDGASIDDFFKITTDGLVINNDFDKDDKYIPNLKPNLGIVCRKDYKQKYNNDKSDYYIFELAKLIGYSENPNCEIVQQQNYSRSNPNQKSYCYILYPLRDLKSGQKITVKKNSYPLNKILCSTNSFGLIRSQPDYGQKNEQKISKQLYDNYLKVSKIVQEVYKNSFQNMV